MSLHFSRHRFYMSVYTFVSRDQLNAFLQGYSIGKLVSYEGIANGITNSNFWLKTEAGAFVLTLYEHHQTSDLDYILGLQHHLIQKGIACASPVHDNNGRFYSTLNNKPAAINRRVSGEVCQTLTVRHCQLVGTELANFHLAGASYHLIRKNPCGSYWRLNKQQELDGYLNESDKKLLAEEITAYEALNHISLPAGAVHADLFHDNCLFDDDRTGGIIDFDYACDEFWLYDLAVTINDWCINNEGELDQQLLRAFLNSYNRVRPLLAIEQDNLALMLRLAAVRFWLSRVYDKAFPLSGELTYTKDPDEFKNILLLRRESIPGI